MRHMRDMSAPAQVARGLDLILSRLMVRDAPARSEKKEAAPEGRPQV